MFAKFAHTDGSTFASVISEPCNTTFSDVVRKSNLIMESVARPPTHKRANEQDDICLFLVSSFPIAYSLLHPQICDDEDLDPVFFIKISIRKALITFI